ncbi:hypothetical protein P152DRAFT_127095 [Eremomyces bilateralis CBS 781.70]|uniref:Uncharacterized protein n=1 Tax=Eremomyces bilateralis CBS 781.70 TaxID=1392243 RepID=A0A6G1GFA0_9PEZI|nr:uncharacterized protein P152DRAFT_127095 [Eremomyces bilateralis CBS 781.70]KAF1816530.1 hypothetical protein P152DRAFT_127095 [Eremomyces bilateralis CBS 781.70]
MQPPTAGMVEKDKKSNWSKRLSHPFQKDKNTGGGLDQASPSTSNLPSGSVPDTPTTSSGITGSDRRSPPNQVVPRGEPTVRKEVHKDPNTGNMVTTTTTTTTTTTSTITRPSGGTAATVASSQNVSNGNVGASPSPQKASAGKASPTRIQRLLSLKKSRDHSPAIPSKSTMRSTPEVDASSYGHQQAPVAPPTAVQNSSYPRPSAENVLGSPPSGPVSYQQPTSYGQQTEPSHPRSTMQDLKAAVRGIQVGSTTHDMCVRY